MDHTQFQIIFIMLGNACNFQCTYCMQGEHKTCVQQPILSDKLLSFLDNYQSEEKTYLCFWGGEPLLYFPAIKEIVERYKNKFKYETVSNGSLLTQEIVDFLNKYDVRFCLSHDGKITKQTRGIDVLKNEKIKSLYEKINTRLVNITYSSVSPPLEQIINSYPLEQTISINTMINTTDTEISRKYAEFDMDKYKRDIEYLLLSYEDYMRGDHTKRREYENVYHMIHALSVYLKEGRQVNRCYDCGRGKKMLNVDTCGNLYMCHNSRIRIGTVEDSWSDVEKNIERVLSKSLEKCEKCEFNKVCGGSCMLLSGVGEEQKCRLSKMFYSIFIPWVMRMRNNGGICNA